MDVENEIEKEIDIIYTGKYPQDLKIFQFPLMPINTLKTEKISRVGINNNVNSIKIDMTIDNKYLDIINYNSINKHTLKGEKIESNANLCIGIFKNNKLYLTPISQIYQFRHDFSEMEKNQETLKKDKKEKKDFRNNFVLKEELTESNNYIPLNVIQPNNIESNIIKSNLYNNSEYENETVKKPELMEKRDYINLMMKYIVNEVNNDIYLENTNIIDDSNNFNKLSSIKETEMEIEDEKNFNAKKYLNKTEQQENLCKTKSESIIVRYINQIFSTCENITLENLINKICNEMNIDISDNFSISKIQEEINKHCIIVKNNICFIKDKGDLDIKELRNILIEAIGNSNGLKKKEIRDILNSKKINVIESKLNKILKILCNYVNSTWIIKTPLD